MNSSKNVMRFINSSKNKLHGNKNKLNSKKKSIFCQCQTQPKLYFHEVHAYLLKAQVFLGKSCLG